MGNRGYDLAVLCVWCGRDLSVVGWTKGDRTGIQRGERRSDGVFEGEEQINGIFAVYAVCI